MIAGRELDPIESCRWPADHRSWASRGGALHSPPRSWLARLTSECNMSYDLEELRAAVRAALVAVRSGPRGYATISPLVSELVAILRGPDGFDTIGPGWLYLEPEARRLLRRMHDFLSCNWGPYQVRRNPEEFEGMAEAALSIGAPKPEAPELVASPSGSKADGQAPRTGTPPEPKADGRTRAMKQPHDRAIAAYRVMIISEGINETEAARRFGVCQSTINRWKHKVSAWLKAGNVLPDLEAPRPRTVKVDPARLDLGKRLDGRKAR